DRPDEALIQGMRLSFESGALHVKGTVVWPVDCQSFGGGPVSVDITFTDNGDVLWDDQAHPAIITVSGALGSGSAGGCSFDFDADVAGGLAAAGVNVTQDDIIALGSAVLANAAIRVAGGGGEPAIVGEASASFGRLFAGLPVLVE